MGPSVDQLRCLYHSAWKSLTGTVKDFEGKHGPLGETSFLIGQSGFKIGQSRFKRTEPCFKRWYDAMPYDPYDPYRDALVVEEETIWPPEFSRIAPDLRAAVDRLLHQNAQRVQKLEYVRLPTGFCRRITVTAEELAWAQAELEHKKGAVGNAAP